MVWNDQFSEIWEKVVQCEVSDALKVAYPDFYDPNANWILCMIC
jgi:hypothetical protein